MEDKFILGIAYYPEHWDRDLWGKDLTMMKDMGISAIRVGEFAWKRIEIREGVFDFEWLDKFNSLARDNGIKLILCTPTEAPPPWLWSTNSKIFPVNLNGLPYGASGRRHYCVNSKTYNIYSDKITEVMAKHFKGNENIFGWQLDNEAGCHTQMRCYCSSCQNEFRRWLKDKYVSVDNLNKEWGLVFWSGEVNSFEEIVLHHNHLTLSNPGYELDVQRFASDSWIKFLGRQANIIRKYSSKPITHNVTWYAEQLDIYKLGKILDVIGVDIYQRHPELITMADDIFYSAKKKSFWVMEMGSDDYKVAIEDGIYNGGESQKAAIVKHIMQGASLCSLFRWRSSPCGGEMEIGTGGLNYHDHTPTHTYYSLKNAQLLFQKLYKKLPNLKQFDAAIVLDYSDYFMIYSTPTGRNGNAFSRTYVDYFHDILNYYQTLSKAGISCTFVSENESLAPYKIVITPEKWTIDEELGEKFNKYVENGGILIASDRFGVHTKNGRMTCLPLPGYCTELFGIYFNEFFSPREINGNLKIKIGSSEFCVDRQVSPIISEGAEIIGFFKGGSYEGRGAISKNKFGKGHAYYIGAILEADGTSKVLSFILNEEAINYNSLLYNLPRDIEIIKRGDIVAFFNHSTERIILTPILHINELLTGTTMTQISIDGLDCSVCEIVKEDTNEQK